MSNVIWLIMGGGVAPALRRDRAPAVRRIRARGAGTDDRRRRRPRRTPTAPSGARTTGARSGVLASSAVMAAGTVVSRLSGFVRGRRCWRRRWAPSCTPTCSPSPTPSRTCSTSCWRAASSTPCWCRSWCGRCGTTPTAATAYTNRIITLAALFLGAVTVLLVVAAPLGDAALPRRALLRRPSWPRSATRSSPSPGTACRRSSSTACSCWSGRCSTPAAGSGR